MYNLQTYDSWAMKGPSAYCGGLWLATLSVAVEMANENGEENMAKEWSDALAKAREAYQEKLWNDEKKFFKFDATERGKSYSKTLTTTQIEVTTSCQCKSFIL